MWREDGTLRLEQTSGIVPLHLVPLASALSGGSDHERIRLRVADLASGGVGAAEADTDPQTSKAKGRPQEDPVFRTVLYPGSAQERATLPADLARLLNTPGTDHLPSEEDIARLLPVSPLSVHSLERIARAIRWWVLDGLFTRYPAPEVLFPARAQQYGAIPGEWLALTAERRARARAATAVCGRKGTVGGVALRDAPPGVARREKGPGDVRPDRRP